MHIIQVSIIFNTTIPLTNDTRLYNFKLFKKILFVSEKHESGRPTKVEFKFNPGYLVSVRR